jgi:hypothetical protein
MNRAHRGRASVLAVQPMSAEKKRTIGSADARRDAVEARRAIISRGTEDQ